MARGKRQGAAVPRKTHDKTRMSDALKKTMKSALKKPVKIPVKKTMKSTPKNRKKSARREKAGAWFGKLVGVMARLRAPGGCPWDREQTHATLRTYLIEEAYEVLDALDSTDDTKFAEELGDLLLQDLFHAQIAHEEGRFDITTVIREIYEKMIRRHPHVFGNAKANSAAEVLRNWEQIKKEERAKSGASTNQECPESLLDGVPRTMPALLEAFQLTSKAARIGFDWHNLDGIFAKLQEETHELQSALVECGGGSLDPPAVALPSSTSPTQSQRIESELGDLLFVAVNLSRFLKVDPEIALKKTSAKFSRRF